MNWVLSIPIALLILMLAVLRPLWIHPGYQVAYKSDACREALTEVRELGYKLLLNSHSSYLTEECSSSKMAYCLVIPGTKPLKFLRVEEG